MTSPRYPDRLIRPLPKHPLRSRLSPEAAGSILYPPAPPTTATRFPFTGSYGNPRSQVEVTDQCTCGLEHENHEHVHHEEEGLDSGEDDSAVLIRRFNGARDTKSPSLHGKNNRQIERMHPYGKPEPTPPKSTSSSADGYDSFENTNNKKKRKIPTSGNIGNHHSSLSADLANMGISSSTPRDIDPDSGEDGTVPGPYYGSGNPAVPVGSAYSGSGRGRGGVRASNGRSPLKVQQNGSNTWTSGRTLTPRREWSGNAAKGTIAPAGKFIMIEALTQLQVKASKATKGSSQQPSQAPPQLLRHQSLLRKDRKTSVSLTKKFARNQRRQRLNSLSRVNLIRQRAWSGLRYPL